MKIWRVILATLVIFGAGIGVGALFGRRAEPVSAPAIRVAGPQGMNPGQARLQQLLRRMDRELGLTPEQHERIDKIIAASQDRTKELWKPVAVKVNAETQKVCDEIRDELTPDQKVKFDTFSRERGERGGERGNRHRQPGGPTNSPGIRTNEQP